MLIGSLRRLHIAPDPSNGAYVIASVEWSLSSEATNARLRRLGKGDVTAPRALALSDKQLALLQRAAAALPVGERDHFLQSVAAHLSGQPTDDAVIAAINAAVDAAAVAWRA